MPQFRYGPIDITFSGTGNFSGNPPTQVKGPDRDMYQIEHQIPAREGGIMEYLGSKQPTYQIKGFVSPSQDGPFNGTSMMLLSGTGYVPQNADDSKQDLFLLRGSGANILLIESTASMQSGYQQFYENGFFLIEKSTFGFEAGHTYPYYPYSIDFHGASPSYLNGFSGGTTVWPGMSLAGGGYVSGFMLTFFNVGAMTLNATVNTIGVYVLSVSSGSMAVGVYNGITDSLAAQSAPQLVHSGWNWFPLRPSYTTASGRNDVFGILGTATNSSGLTIGGTDQGSTNVGEVVFSGHPIQSGFPSSLVTIAGYTSGFYFDVMAATA